MTLEQLVCYTREDILRDLDPDAYLWSDKELMRYAKEATVEACKRAPLLNATHTITIKADTATYTLHDNIRQIVSAVVASELRPIPQSTEYETQLMFGPDWRDRTGSPRHYIRTNKKILIYPIPVDDDSLILGTLDKPDDGFYLDDDFDSSYHQGLQHWIAHRAYMKQDSNTLDAIKSADYLAMFNDKFGIPKSARYEQFSFNNPMYGTVISGRMA